MYEVDDVRLVVERVAALDLGKAALEVCVRPTSSGPAGGCRSCAARHHHRAAVGDGGPAAAVARAAGGDGVLQTGGSRIPTRPSPRIYWKTRSSSDR